jgi:hypothetical protein
MPYRACWCAKAELFRPNTELMKSGCHTRHCHASISRPVTNRDFINSKKAKLEGHGLNLRHAGAAARHKRSTGSSGISSSRACFHKGECIRLLRMLCGQGLLLPRLQTICAPNASCVEVELLLNSGRGKGGHGQFGAKRRHCKVISASKVRMVGLLRLSACATGALTGDHGEKGLARERADGGVTEGLAVC